ncbi:IS66 family insertion sequence element accessory protein TnpB [Thiolapillus sp.]|uniref:IS66 family insertion sequence element accessory protein TnpB n=15 Tax=Thiolapillus sp. TaxID=2017437 RepID=UPI003AF9F5F6
MEYRLRPHPQMPRIYLYQDPVDFRKSFRSLAAIVEQELGHNPFEGALYAFTNRRRDKIKLLYWEDNGFVLYYKSLAEEKFHWPGGEEELVSKRVFGLVIDFGTSQSPKSTQPLTTYLCPSRPGHQALRNNFASSLLLRT